MRKQRVVVLVHESLVPPESMEGYSDKEVAVWKTEFDVISTLKDMGHEVTVQGLSDELRPLRQALNASKPHLAFNLLEEFHNIAAYDQHVVSYLELMRLLYTGCNPRGMLLSRDKALSKKILLYHRIRTPRFAVLPRRKRYRTHGHLRFPLIVWFGIDGNHETGAHKASLHN